jgi:hypothetical protein
MHRLQKVATIFCAFKKIHECQKEQAVSKWKAIIAEKIRSESVKWILICGYFMGKNS